MESEEFMRGTRYVLDYFEQAGKFVFTEELQHMLLPLNPKFEQIKDLPLSEITAKIDSRNGTGTRAKNCMKGLGINTIGQFVQVPYRELVKTQNFGSVTYRNMIDQIKTMI